MADQFIAEIRLFPFNFAPTGWAMCLGQLVSISQYTALFSLLGTNFGGNGTSTFALPNLQGTSPMHWGNGAGLSSYYLGEVAGSATVTLTLGQMPLHNHLIMVGEGGSPTNAPSTATYLGQADAARWYLPSGTPNVTLAANAIGFAGGSQPHPNQQPYQTLNFCIALSGTYPPRS
jgi:microcystin-dependent protein